MPFEINQIYMQRAIELARNGLGSTSPNPMVGAVIVHHNRIIGEGWHRRCGEAHAEVNAVNSVCDKSLLADSTIYVTLEPCSHYGKTPPCAKLLVDCGIKRVVVGSLDPFDKVSGRGVEMLRCNGVDVVVGVLERECRDINPVFMTAHATGRPWVTLKWAQSSDGFIDRKRRVDEPATALSWPLTSVLTHRLRSLHDAILVGSGTMIADRPRLDVRGWTGRSPLRYFVDRSGAVNAPDGFVRLPGESPHDMLQDLYSKGVTSLLVEGGAHLLQSFVDSGAYNLIRVETATGLTISDGVAAPVLPGMTPVSTHYVGSSRFDYYGTLPWYLKP